VLSKKNKNKNRYIPAGSRDQKEGETFVVKKEFHIRFVLKERVVKERHA
jgi:hypothetical protein